MASSHSSRSLLAAALLFTAFASAQAPVGGFGGFGGISNFEEVRKEKERQMMLVKAHGTLMALAFAVLFPLGAMSLHALKFKGFIWFHAGWQLTAWTIMLASFGLGIYLADIKNLFISRNGHAIIGIVVVTALIFQPIGGYMAHRIFAKTGQKNSQGKGHRWNGRVFIALGVINGGLGFQLTGSHKFSVALYSAICLVSFGAWGGMLFWGALKERRAVREEGKFIELQD